MGSGAGKPKETPEEKALMRAQVLSLSKADEEIQKRRSRIIRGEYAGFGGLLKGSGKGRAAPAVDLGQTQPVSSVRRGARGMALP